MDSVGSNNRRRRRDGKGGSCESRELGEKNNRMKRGRDDLEEEEEVEG